MMEGKCKQLLASGKWNSQDASSYRGKVSRLTQLRDSGLPPMRILPHKTLEALSRIPCSDEGKLVDALTEVQRCGGTVFGDSLALVVYVSHHSTLPPGKANRDGAQSLAKALINWGNWFLSHVQEGSFVPHLASLPPFWFPDDKPKIELFYWIDWACIDEKNAGPELAALPAYIGASGFVLAEWSPEYERAARNRAELALAWAFMTDGDTPLLLPKNFLNSGIRDFTFETKSLADPCGKDGDFNEDDKNIRALRELAMTSQTFSFGKELTRALCNTQRGCRQCVAAVACSSLCCFCCSIAGAKASSTRRKMQFGENQLSVIVPSGAKQFMQQASMV